MFNGSKNKNRNKLQLETLTFVRNLKGDVMKFLDSDIYAVVLIVFAILFVFTHVVLYLTK